MTTLPLGTYMLLSILFGMGCALAGATLSLTGVLVGWFILFRIVAPKAPLLVSKPKGSVKVVDPITVGEEFLNPEAGPSVETYVPEVPKFGGEVLKYADMVAQKIGAVK